MPTRNSKAARESAWLGVSLTWTAGFVDAVGYITLYEIYAANMSGNSVGFALYSALANWREAFAHGWPVVAFFPGLIVGALIVQFCKYIRLRGALMPAMLLEAGLLVWFIFVAPDNRMPKYPPTPLSPTYILAVGLIAFSMGLQNGALRQIGALQRVHTYVTGTLLAAAQGISEFLFWLARRLRRNPTRMSRILRSWRHQPPLRVAIFAAALWIFYVIGAIVGALLLIRFGTLVIFAPVGVLVMIAAIDLIAPVALYLPECSRISSRCRSES